MTKSAEGKFQKILMVVSDYMMKEEHYREAIKREITKLAQEQTLKSIKIRDVQTSDQNRYGFPSMSFDNRIIEMIPNYNPTPLTRNTFEIKSKELSFLR